MDNENVTEKEKTLLEENDALRMRLAEAEETLRAIHRGDIDAIIVSGDDGEKVFTLVSAETPYRIAIEEMNEGVATLSSEGLVLYCNRRLSELLSTPVEHIVGSEFIRFVEEKERLKFHELIEDGRKGKTKGEIAFCTSDNNLVHINLSLSPLPPDIAGDVCIIATDITKLKKEKEKLRHGYTRIEETIKERTIKLNTLVKELNESRLAALNIMEDAVEAKNKLETINRELLKEIAERRRAEKEREQTLEKLRKTLGATVQAMATAVELRDPYTAGHQLRVANLARIIATEMGVSSNIIDGLRMAGVIHDIGKISIPAEILSKPGKLTEIEFKLLKNHPEIGFNILKDIEFPWPIARMVLEHHERLNGSGYPNGLKGDGILLEARILAVADVIEAMASHRPYRPALGIDVAMDEISRNRGTLYDPDVVDACIRLFKEKGYRLT